MESITIEDMKRYIARKERMREYSKEYRRTRKEYYAQKQREYRARQKARKETEDDVQESGQ